MAYATIPTTNGSVDQQASVRCDAFGTVDSFQVCAMIRIDAARELASTWM